MICDRSFPPQKFRENSRKMYKISTNIKCLKSTVVKEKKNYFRQIQVPGGRSLLRDSDITKFQIIAHRRLLMRCESWRTACRLIHIGQTFPFPVKMLSGLKKNKTKKKQSRCRRLSFIYASSLHRHQGSLGVCGRRVWRPN